MKRKSTEIDESAIPISCASSSSKKSRRDQVTKVGTRENSAHSIHDLSNIVTTTKMAHGNITANLKHTSLTTKTYYLLGGLASLAIGRKVFMKSSHTTTNFLYAPIHGGKMQGASSIDLHKQLAITSSSRLAWSNETYYNIKDISVAVIGNNGSISPVLGDSSACHFNLSGISSGDHLRDFLYTGDSVASQRRVSGGTDIEESAATVSSERSRDTVRPPRSWLRSQLSRQRSQGIFIDLFGGPASEQLVVENRD